MKLYNLNTYIYIFLKILLIINDISNLIQIREKQIIKQIILSTNSIFFSKILQNCTKKPQIIDAFLSARAPIYRLQRFSKKRKKWQQTQQRLHYEERTICFAIHIHGGALCRMRGRERKIALRTRRCNETYRICKVNTRLPQAPALESGMQASL